MNLAARQTGSARQGGTAEEEIDRPAVPWELQVGERITGAGQVDHVGERAIRVPDPPHARITGVLDEARV
jgi:hypothetical protein